MPNIDLLGPAEESSWRRVALSAWRTPKDPTVLGIMDVDAGALLERMEELKSEGVRVTITHMVARAVGLALARHPETNVAIRFGRAWLRERVDVFVHVMVPGEGDMGSTDLSGIKVLNADKKNISEIAEEVNLRAQKVREDDDPEFKSTKASINSVPRFVLGLFFKFLNFFAVDLNLDLKRIGVAKDPFGSVGVTNVGVFGVDTALTALFPLNGPSFFVVISSLKDRPVVDEAGEVVARPILRLGGTFDHRVFDGFQIATLAKEIRVLLENGVAEL